MMIAIWFYRCLLSYQEAPRSAGSPSITKGKSKSGNSWTTTVWFNFLVQSGSWFSIGISYLVSAL